MSETRQEQRIDKWLWHARFAKTRSLAQKLVSGGNVRLDRTKVTSNSQPVRPGNVLTITLARDVRIIEIKDLAERRGPYQQALTLYNDLTPEKADKPQSDGSTEPQSEVVKEKRPTSRNRRIAIKLKQGSNDS